MRRILENLRLAVVTSQHRSLHKAAEALSLRQSTLSRRLRDLELEVGVDLFERSRTGTVPNDAGRALIEAARRAIVDIDYTVTSIKSISRGERGRLVIGVGAATSAGGINSLLVEYGRQFPQMDLVLADQVGGYPISEMTAHQIDIAIVMGRLPLAVGRCLSLWSERVVVVLPETHRLASSSFIRWSELGAECLLVSHRTPELSRLAAAKAHSGALGKVRVQDIGPDALPGLVRSRIGLGLVTECVTGITLPGVTFREVHDDDGPTRLPFTAYWRQDNNNPALRSFLDLLRERYPDLSGTPSGHEA